MHMINASPTISIMYSSAIQTITLFLLLHLCTTFAWMPDVRPDLQPKHDIIISRFLGNTTDYFKILASDENTILLGARDVIYNISINGLREISRIEWPSSDADRELCALKGKHDADCHNYIRVFAHTDTNQIMVCGTNSYKPRCRQYVMGNNSKETALKSQPQYELIKDVEAQGLCPYSPSHNSTFVYTGGQLYSATVADFSGSDPLIYRENLRTEQYDLKQLNQPDFVGAVERNGFVLFFFREISMEYMNCGKAIYSRVGRVCKNDRGGPYTLSKSWTSFLKTRLNCSVPGEYPFYFDEIQAISNIIDSEQSGLIYAVFTTSVNAIPGSAVCAFKVNDILATFEGRFKSQKDSQSNWLPIQNEHVPEPRPGQCVDDSRMLSSTAVNFIKNHPLMETAVPAAYGKPLLTKVNLHHRLTTITVDRQVTALNGEQYDVIYVGTDDGKITKFTNIPITPGGNNGEQKLKTVLISERQVLPIGVAVKELFVATKTNTLIVTSDSGLVAVPLHHCPNIYECQACLSLQDPNCAWDLQNRECKTLGSNKFGTKAFIQSLNTTKKAAAALCPKTMPRGVVQPTLIGLSPLGSPSVSSASGELNNGLTIEVSAQIPDSDGVEVGMSDSYDDESNLFGMKGRTAFAGKNGGKFNIGNGGLDVADNGGGDYIINNDNKITLTSVPDDFTHTLNDPLLANGMVDEQNVQLAGKSFYWGFAFVVLSLVFLIGMFVGLYTSRRMCKSTAFHANHRNQLSTPRPFTTNHHRNSGKDVNLLVNTNPFVPCNQKKANVDIVGEKDRSHECKNSTENLEKEIPCKTSTLTKVKRTYI